MLFLKPSLHTLPFELIEETIIFATLLGDTRTAATLAQTCRRFRAFVYHQSHKHLWRELFLVIFDNPFPARDVSTHGRAPLPHLRPGKGQFRGCHSERVFSWEGEYKRRIWTASFILRRTRHSQDCALSNLSSSDVEVHTALQTLLRAISTASPLPYHTLACMEPPSSPLVRPHPICPLFYVAAHLHAFFTFGSRNTAWLARVLANGLPDVLMARLTVFDEQGRVEVQKRPVEWDGLLAKLVAQFGLTAPISTKLSVEEQRLPTPLSSLTSTSNGGNDVAVSQVTDITGQPIEEGEGDSPVARDDRLNDESHDLDPLLSGSESGSESDVEGTSEINGDEILGSVATSATTSLQGVRRLARIRVYNMAYLHSSRAFGPFLSVDNRPSKPSCSMTLFADGEGNQGSEDGISLTDVPPVPAIPDNSFHLGVFLDNGDNFSLGEDGDEDDQDVFSSRPSSRGDSADAAASPSSPSVPQINPSADQLRFDWAWIAAARQVIELNLRDLLMTRHREVLRALLSLEGLRSCSAPGFPLAAPEWPAAESESSGGEDGWQYKDGEGWDWAGVEGQWRYVIYVMRSVSQ